MGYDDFYDRGAGQMPVWNLGQGSLLMIYRRGRFNNLRHVLCFTLF